MGYIVEGPTLYMVCALIAGFCTTFSFLPQFLKTYQSKDVSSLSFGMYFIYCLGLVCWFTYGIFLGSLPLMFFNLVSFMLAFPVLCMIFWYKKPQDKKDGIKEVKNIAKTKTKSVKTAKKKNK